MSSAKLYISSDVVDRLTRPIASSGSAEDSSQHPHHHPQQRFDSTSPSGRSSRSGVMNIQSFLGSLQGGGGGGTKTAAATAVVGGGMQHNNSPQQSSEEKLKRQLKFESFLNRQKAIMKRKEEQIQQVRTARTVVYSPCDVIEARLLLSIRLIIIYMLLITHLSDDVRSPPVPDQPTNQRLTPTHPFIHPTTNRFSGPLLLSSVRR